MSRQVVGGGEQGGAFLRQVDICRCDYVIVPCLLIFSWQQQPTYNPGLKYMQLGHLSCSTYLPSPLIKLCLKMSLFVNKKGKNHLIINIVVGKGRICLVSQLLDQDCIILLQICLWIGDFPYFFITCFQEFGVILLWKLIIMPLFTMVFFCYRNG